MTSAALVGASSAKPALHRQSRIADGRDRGAEREGPRRDD
jgi:hypothetical protein